VQVSDCFGEIGETRQLSEDARAPKVAIIGSGPTAIYVLKHLSSASKSLNISIFEAQADAGTGSPYRPALNDKAMLSNIASIEIPPIAEKLVEWLHGLPDSELSRLEINRSDISDRAFFPRLVLGEFFRAQFAKLLALATHAGHRVSVYTKSRVTDIVLGKNDIALRVDETGEADHTYDYVVMATGHDWPENTQPKPGYFTSPWPASALREIGSVSVGIRGTSLSAIDALVTVAAAHGVFLRDEAGALRYHSNSGSDGFHITIMSRKGLLPEADFFHPVPYIPLRYCTRGAGKKMVEEKRTDLLDGMFHLFCEELLESDPDYASRLNLSTLTVETFGDAYFSERERSDPFVWAAKNLAEAAANNVTKTTVAWRYAILRMHEVFALVVPYFSANDLERFHKHLKQVFADDYATVPHESIERLLALRQAEKLDIVKLGNDYSVETEASASGAVLRMKEQSVHFPAFIEATGQDALSAPDLPFPSLLQAGEVTEATVPAGGGPVTFSKEEPKRRTNGIKLDAKFRPVIVAPVCNNLFCLSLPFLLHQYPFVQGIGNSSDLAQIVSDEICLSVGIPGALLGTSELKSGAPMPLSFD